MVAVVNGSGLGLFTSSPATRGNVGSATGGQNGESVYVNSDTGNLVIQDTDEQLGSVGPNLSLVRTYNSQGLMNDDNGDNWRLSVQENLFGLTGTVNTAGSTITKQFGDGAQVVYTYSTALGLYTSATGNGAHDTLGYSSTTSQWTWTEGSRRDTETYDSTGRLLNYKDVNGNGETYQYTGSLLTQITDTSGQTTFLDYTGNNLTQIRVVSNGQTQTLTRYGYDGQNRLQTVTTDLLPADNSISDGKTYVTTYGYDGTSTRVASITQGDGTTVSFTYVVQDGAYRVKTYTDGVGKVTTFNYSSPSSSGTSSNVTVPANSAALSTTNTSSQSYAVNSGALSTTDTVTQTYNLNTSAETTSAVTPTFVQGTSQSPLSPASSVSATFTNAQTAGNLNYVAISWNDSTSSITSITDSKGNVYTAAIGPTKSNGNATQYIYYAKNIVAAAAGTNTLTVTFSGAVAFPDLRIVEYRGLNSTSPVDVTKGAAGTGTATNSGAVTTTNAKDLLVGANYLQQSNTAVGASWTQELLTVDQDVVEDRVVSAVGSYNTNATQSPSGWYVMQLVAFKAALSTYYLVPSGATWQSIANALYGVNSAAAGTALQTAMGNPTLSTGLHLTGMPATLSVTSTVTVPAYYTIPGGATWQSIANTLYGVNSTDAASALQTAMGNPPLTAGNRLTGLPANLVVTTTTTVPAYYLVPAGATWASITQAVYGTSNTNAVAALQTATGNPTLTAGLHLTVPATLQYSAPTTIYLRTDITDGVGQVTSYIEDSLGRVTSILSPAVGGTQLRTDYGYDSDNNILTVTRDPSGLNRVTTMTYDTNGNLLTSRDADGDTVSRTYNAANQLVTETTYTTPDPDGSGSGLPTGPMTVRYAYDSFNRLRFTISADGRVTEVQYKTDTSGEVAATLTYGGAAYNLSSLAPTDTLSESTMSTWASSQDKTKAERTDYTYDFRGNLSTATVYTATSSTGAGAGTASTTQYVYDQRGQLLQEIDPRGIGSAADGTTTTLPYATTYTYDGLGRLSRTVQWATTGHTITTATTYTGSSSTIQTTFANGLVTTKVYDAAGHLISTANSGPGIQGSSTTTYQYDADGRLAITTDPTGIKHYIVYDEAGRRAGQVDVSGDGDGSASLTQYVYDNANDLVKTVQYADRLSATTVATLTDSSGKPLTVSIANLVAALPNVVGRAYDQITRAVFDVAGRKVYDIDAMGDVTQYGYDGAGRLTTQLDYAGRVTIPAATNALLPSQVGATATPGSDRQTSYSYDNDGHPVGQLDARGYLTRYIYDAAGQLTQKIAYATASPTAVYAAGSWSNLPTAVPGQDEVSAYFYDDEGRQIGLFQSANYKVPGYADGTGYFTQTQYDQNNNVSTVTQYDRRNLTYTAGTTSYTDLLNAATGAATHVMSYVYDGLNRLTQQTNFEGTVTTYSYDDAGNLISQTDALGSLVTNDTRTTQFQYDALGRETAAISAQGSALIAGGMSATQAWTQYGTSYTYDSAGRRTSQTVTAYDPNANPPTTQTETTQYFYNQAGQLRFTMNARGEVTENQYNVLGQLTAQIEYTGRVTNPSALVGGLLTSAAIATLTGIAIPGKDKKTTYTYKLNGEVATTVTAEGGSVTNDYNAFGEVQTRTTLVDASRSVSLIQGYTYDLDGNLHTVQSDATGANQLLTYGYDAFDRQTSATDQYGNKSSTQYDPLGRVIVTIDAITNAANGSTGTATSTTTTYDAFSRVLTTKDAFQNATQYSYSDTSQSVTVTTPEGVSVTTVHNRNGQVLTVTSASNVTHYAYDLNGRVTDISDNLGALDHRTYDSAGREVTDTDGNLTLTSFTYDAANRVLTRTVDPKSASNPNGLALTTMYGYDGAGQVTSTTNSNGIVTATEYDRDGRVSKVTVDPYDVNTNPNGLNLVTTYAYDNEGDVVTLTQGSGSSNPLVTQYTYDALGRRTQQVVDFGTGNNPATGQPRLNATTKYAYDANGNLVHKTDANGNSTWYVYNADNNLHYTIDALGGITETTYDANARVSGTRRYATAMTPPASTVDRLTESQISPVPTNADQLEQTYYDGDGREAYTIDALGTVTQRTYDASGNVIQLRVIGGVALTGTYANAAAVKTALGTVWNTLGATDRVQWTVYDARGQATFTIDALGAVTQNQYDKEGNLVSSTAYATLVTPPSTFVMSLSASGQTITVNGSSTINVGTNASDRTTRNWYDAAGRLVYTLSAAGYLTRTQYDDVAHTQKVTVYATPPTIPAGVKTSDLVNGTNGVVITANPGTTLSTGQVVGADQITTTYFDTAGRVSKVTDALNQSETYHYDALGNKTSYTNKINQTWTYKYDANGDLIEEDSPYVNVSNAAPSGGSLSATVVNASIVTRMTYDQLGNVKTVTEGIEHFSNGTENSFYSRLTTYGYDLVGRQTSVTLPSVPVYKGISADNVNASGSAVGSNSASTTPPSTQVVYDTLGNEIAGRDAAGNWTYKVYDQQGRVVYQIDALNYVTGYTYDAFGNQVTTTRYSNQLSGSITGSTLTGLQLKNVVSGVITFNVTNGSTPSTVSVTALPSQDRTISTSYDRDNRVKQVSQPAVYTFVPGSQPFTAAPTTFYDYNAFGQMVRTATLVNTNNNSITDPDVNSSLNTWTYGYTYYDRAGNKAADINADGYLTTYQYDAEGNLTDQYEYAGQVGTASISGYLPPVSNIQTSVNGSTATVSWTPDAGVTSGNFAILIGGTWNTYTGTLASGRYTASFSLPAAGAYQFRITDLVSGVNQAQGIGTITFTANSSSVSTPGSNRETQYQYDGLNRQATQILKAVQYSQITGSAGSLSANDTGSADAVTSYGYDALGNQTSVTANGATTSTYYDQLGRAIATVGPASNRGDGTTVTPLTLMQRDVYGNVVVQTQYAAGLTSVPSGGAPPTTSNTTPNADQDRTTLILRDVEGHALQTEQRLTSLNSGEGSAISYIERYDAYDAVGNVVKEYQAANATDTLVTFYVYDALGRQTDVIRPQVLGGTNQVSDQYTQYNPFGEVIAKGTGNYGDAKVYSEFSYYDAAGRVYLTNANTGAYCAYLYDLSGNATGQLEDQWTPGSTSYDLSALATQSSAANAYTAFVGGTSALMFTQTRYDAMGNVVQQFLPTYSSPNTAEAVNNGTVQVQNLSGINYLTWYGPADATLQVSLFQIDGADKTSQVTTLSGPGNEYGYVAGFDLTGLGDGPHSYRIEYRRPSGTDTVLAGVATGTFNVNQTLAATVGSIGTVSNVSAALVGSNLAVSWTPDNTSVAAVLWLLVGGTWQSYSAPLNESGIASVSLLSPGPGTYQYRLTDSLNGETEAQATGSITITAATTNTSLGVTPATVGAVNSVVASVSGSTVTMGWTPDSGTTSAAFAILIGGTWTSYTPTTSESGTYSVSFPLPAAGTYTYRITDLVNGATEAQIVGNVTFTAATSSTSLTNAAGTIGTVNSVTSSVSGSTATVGWAVDAGVSSTAFAILIGGTWTSYTPSLTESGTYTVSFAMPAAGTYSYRITNFINGVTEAQGVGNITFTAAGSSISLSNATATTGTVNSVSSSVSGSTVTVGWAPDGGVTSSAFAILIGGTWTGYTPSVTESGTYTVSFPLPAAGTYTYRITDFVNGVTEAQGVGNITFTAASSSTSTTGSSSPAAVWYTPSPVSASASVGTQGSGVVNSSAQPSQAPIFNEFGQVIGNTDGWNNGSNGVTLNFLSLASGTYTLNLFYNTLAVPANGISSVSTSRGFTISGGSQVFLTWSDGSATNSWPPGGISSINYFQILQGGTVVRDSRTTGVATTTISWSAPADSSYVGALSYRVASTGGYSILAATRSGNTFFVNLSQLAPGTYDYIAQDYQNGAESPVNVTQTSGQFTVGSSSASVISQSGTPGYLSGVGVSGSNLVWSRAMGSGDSLSVQLTGPGTYNLSPGTSDGTNYAASFYNIPTGTYTYNIYYVNGGSTYLQGQGTISINTTTTNTAATSSIGAPTQLSAVSGFADAGNGVFQWATAGNAGDSVVFHYKAHGASSWAGTLGVSGSGPYSVNLSSLSGSIDYEIDYTASGAAQPYRVGRGTVTINVNSTPASSSIGAPTQLSTVTGFSDLGNKVFGWTTAANSGDSIVFHYKAAGASTWAGTLTVSGTGPYSVNLGSLSGSIDYEVDYTASGAAQPYRVGRGTVTINVNTTPATASLGSSTQLTTITGFSDLGNGVLGWTTTTNAGDTIVFHYKTAGASTWAGTLTVSGTGPYSVNLGSLSGSIDYEVDYTASGGAQPYRVGRGTVAINRTPVSGTASATAASNLSAITGFTDAGNGQFRWTTPANAGDSIVFHYKAAGAPSWTNTLTVSGTGPYSVSLSTLSGSIDYEVDYTASGAAQPYRVGRGTIAITTTITGFVDTTQGSLPATAAAPSEQQAMDRWGNIISSTDTTGQTTRYAYNRYNEAIQKIDPTVAVVSVAMAANGASGTVSGPTSVNPTTSNYYDLYGRLVGTKDADGNLNGETYNAASEVISEQHADGGQKLYVYDAFGDQIQATTQVNSTTGYATRNAFDQAGRLTDSEQELVTNTFTTAASGFAHDLLARSNQNVIRIQYGYDGAGRRITGIDGVGDVTTTGYDLHGNVTSTRTPLQANTPVSTQYSYNLEDEKTSETDPDSHVQSWSYGTQWAAYFNHVTGHVDMGGAHFTYTYDLRSALLTSMSSAADAYFGAQGKAYTYDSANHLIEINDTGVNSQTFYDYDTAGRVLRQRTIDGGLVAEDTRTEYDALGRISSLSGVGFSLAYSYDGAGNRTHILAIYSTSVGHTSTQDLWYGYDKMNRVAISQGVNTSGTVGINNSQGTILTYDWRGDRSTATTYGQYVAETVVNESGGNYITFSGQTGMGLYTYGYDGAARLTTTYVQASGTTGLPAEAVDTKVYDQASRLTQDTTLTVNSSNNVDTDVQTNTYYADGTLLSTVTTQNGIRQSSVAYSYSDESGLHSYYDAAGNLMGYSFQVYDSSGNSAYSGSDSYQYALGDSYLQTTHAVHNGTGGPQDGSTINVYNADQQLIQYTDTQGNYKNRYFLNDANGQVLTVVEGSHGDYDANPSDTGFNTKYGANSTIGAAFGDALMSGSAFFQNDGGAEYFFYDSQGNSVGTYGQLDGHLTANFDVNFTPVSQQYPASVPEQYVVAAGDTLVSIAMRVYGDASLWYILVQSNGLTGKGPNDTLAEGTTLTIPNVVVARSNDSHSFKPFDISLALGDTTPTQPIPPPPSQHGGGCGGLGMILMVIVAVIVTIYTAGIAAEAMGATVAATSTTAATAATTAGAWAAGTAAVTGGLTSAAAGIAAAAIGGAVGSIASQLAGMATGVQSGFDWKGVALGAIGAGVTSGLGELAEGVGSIQTFAEFHPYEFMSADAAAGNALTQGIGVATGLQSSFNWRDVAAAAVAAPAAAAAGGYVSGQLSDFGPVVSGFGGHFASTFTGSVVEGAFNGHLNVGQALEDAFANAVGNAIVDEMQQVHVDNRTKEIMEQAGIAYDTVDHRKSVEFTRNLVQQGVTDADALTILENPNIRSGLADNDAAVGGGISDNEASRRAAHYVDQYQASLNPPPDTATPDGQPETIVVEGYRTGPGGSTIAGDVFSGGAKLVEGLTELQAEHPILANVAFTAGKTLLTGGPIKTIVTKLVENTLDGVVGGLRDMLANKATEVTTSFITDLAERNDLKLDLSVAGAQVEIGPDGFGQASGQVAGGAVTTILDGGLSQITQRGANIRRIAEEHEVGEFGVLRAGDEVGDGLQNHHVPQKAIARDTVPGYPQDALAETGPAIRLTDADHGRINALQRANRAARQAMTPEQLLNDDVRMLRSIGVPEDRIAQLVQMSREKYGIGN